MDQEIAIVQQNPLRLIKAFETNRQLTEFLECPMNFVRDSLALSGIECRTYNEVVGKRCYFAKIKNNQVYSFFGFGGPGGSKPIGFLVDRA